MADSRNQDPKAAFSNFIMIESPHDVQNIDSAAALSGMTISMNNQEIVTTNDEVDASTSRERTLDSANRPSSTRILCKCYLVSFIMCNSIKVGAVVIQYSSFVFY